MSKLQFKRVSDKLHEVSNRYWIDTNGKCYKQLITPYIKDVKLNKTDYKKLIKSMEDEYILYKDKYIIFKNGLILSEIKPSYSETSKTYMFNLYLKQNTKEYINVSLHRLMCVVWKDLDFYNKNYHVHHKDKNRGNNTLDNLEVLIDTEHTKKHKKIIEIYKDNILLKVCTIPEALKYCNIEKSTSIYRVLNGKYKKSKGFTFKEL